MAAAARRLLHFDNLALALCHFLDHDCVGALRHDPAGENARCLAGPHRRRRTAGR